MLQFMHVNTKRGTDKILPHYGTVIKECEQFVYLLFQDGVCKVPVDQYKKM
jgi:hypothetical protein